MENCESTASWDDPKSSTKPTRSTNLTNEKHVARSNSPSATQPSETDTPDKTSYDELVQLAKNHMRELNYADAEFAYKEAIKLRPNSAAAWFALGEIAIERQDFHIAADRIRAALIISLALLVPLSSNAKTILVTQGEYTIVTDNTADDIRSRVTANKVAEFLTATNQLQVTQVEKSCPNRDCLVAQAKEHTTDMALFVSVKEDMGEFSYRLVTLTSEFEKDGLFSYTEAGRYAKAESKR